MKMPLFISLACAMAPGVVYAQSEIPALTQQEISEAFERQKTRGLVIAPVSQGAGQTEPGAAVTYAEVDDADGVNVSIVFDFDSAALRPDQTSKLASLCGAMKEVEVEVFRIVGHTDAAGAEDYNERLSRLRAEEVKRHLVSDCGIAAERLDAVGMGEQVPYDPENPRADVNRRVEFQVVS